MRNLRYYPTRSLLQSLKAARSVAIALSLMVVCTSCQHKAKTASSVMFGQAEEEIISADYDLEDIQAAGELIAVTLSGPETYFEYRGQGFGLQYMMSEAFARSVGARLRMEIVNDSAELFARLESGDADLIAMEVDSSYLKSFLEKDVFCLLKSRWVVRTNSPHLATAVNSWWKDDTRQQFLALENTRHTRSRHRRVQSRPPMLSRQNGIISSYDDLFIRHASRIGWDWRLLAAQCYQESGFDPRAVSWAGAQGLMQIMPSTASRLGLSRSDVFKPERNIEAAARYLGMIDNEFADIHSRHERINFILAAYNGGVGHVRDAMALALKYGADPHRWADVDPYILKLSQPRFYRDSAVKYGYLRGSETSGYVRQIQMRWTSYRGSAPAHHTSAASASSSGKPSKVRPRSEYIKDSLLIQ
ncbi:MAG: transglycosylase SLT domain-containing protein [Bacteroidales bacterium]|nr:transglycosylase SLT domain-containing protein [Bacteroidales bacterium]